MPPTRLTEATHAEVFRDTGVAPFFRVAMGRVSRRPAPGFHRPQLSRARIGLYCSPSMPIMLFDL